MQYLIYIIYKVSTSVETLKNTLYRSLIPNKITWCTLNNLKCPLRHAALVFLLIWTKRTRFLWCAPPKTLVPVEALEQTYSQTLCDYTLTFSKGPIKALKINLFPISAPFTFKYIHVLYGTTHNLTITWFRLQYLTFPNLDDPRLDITGSPKSVLLVPQ